jgi:tetratricopeptide (TPR) repeat protein
MRSEYVLPDKFGARSHVTVAQQWAEHDNVRAALSFSFVESTAASVEAALRLVSSYQEIWFETDQLEEGRRWIEQALALDRELAQQRDAHAGAPVETAAYGDWAARPPRQGSWGQHPRVAALNALASVAAMNLYPDVLLAATDEALALARTVGDTLGVAVALTFRAYLAQFRGDPEAITLGEQSLALYRDLGDRHGTWRMLQSLGGALLNRGDRQGAQRFYEEALAMARAVGDIRGNAQELRYLGWIAFLEEEYERAEQFFAESATWWERMPNRRGFQWLLRDEGRLLLAQGNHETAAVRLRESLRLSIAGGDVRTVIVCLEALAGVLARICGSAAPSLRAARLLGAAAAMREVRQLPVPGIDRPAYELAMAAARAALDERAFETAFSEGRAISQDEAVALALDESASA